MAVFSDEVVNYLRDKNVNNVITSIQPLSREKFRLWSRQREREQKRRYLSLLWVVFYYTQMNMTVEIY